MSWEFGKIIFLCYIFYYSLGLIFRVKSSNTVKKYYLEKIKEIKLNKRKKRI